MPLGYVAQFIMPYTHTCVHTYIVVVIVRFIDMVQVVVILIATDADTQIWKWMRI